MNLARINECGIRSPKALEVSQLENANGWALVTEKVPGTTLAEKMTAEPQRFGEYLEMFVDLQIEIHGYTSPLLNRHVEDERQRVADAQQPFVGRQRLNVGRAVVDELVFRETALRRECARRCQTHAADAAHGFARQCQ